MVATAVGFLDHHATLVVLWNDNKAYPNATDLRTHLRGAALRSGWPGARDRVGVSQFELRHPVLIHPSAWKEGLSEVSLQDRP
jgi:hypothetical protein